MCKPKFELVHARPVLWEERSAGENGVIAFCVLPSFLLVKLRNSSDIKAALLKRALYSVTSLTGLREKKTSDTLPKFRQRKKTISLVASKNRSRRSNKPLQRSAKFQLAWAQTPSYWAGPAGGTA